MALLGLNWGLEKSTINGKDSPGLGIRGGLVKSLIVLALVSMGSLLGVEPALATEEEDRHKKTSPHHLDLSLPPLHPDGVLVASNPKAAPAVTAVAKDATDSKVPPADPKSDDDDIDDTKLETDVMPHVEEDSAAALDDMGDVGGDFEE